MTNVLTMLGTFGLVLFIMLAGSMIAAIIVYVIYRFTLRMLNLYYTFEQWMSVKILQSKGIVDLEDDRRETIIACLKEYGVPFREACQFITEINRRLNEKLGQGHTED